MRIFHGRAMTRGDLAEFEKKRNTDHDFPPPLFPIGSTNLFVTNKLATAEFPINFDVLFFFQRFTKVGVI